VRGKANMPKHVRDILHTYNYINGRWTVQLASSIPLLSVIRKYWTYNNNNSNRTMMIVIAAIQGLVVVVVVGRSAQKASRKEAKSAYPHVVLVYVWLCYHNFN